MNDPVHFDRPASLDALRGAARDDRAAADDAVATDWFAADESGTRLPITLGLHGRYASADLDAIGTDILAPLAR